ncbi:hypothetical protein BpHYR1_012630 [Brachionus plicatilis]|uniref:EF-hand domain-containing protein n=1 Tax=Brachionus plicatilis TaxID=10195 RepID=A0A3M7SV44_BRAPC|nr:hypothetical protein BpHYR1_012630 [Brachionus plicatilis]
MSYNKFRFISGIDNSISFDEYLEYTRLQYPHLDPETIFQIAREKFVLIDRNGDNTINYREFVDSEFRENHYPLFNSNFGYGYGPFFPYNGFYHHYNPINFSFNQRSFNHF